MSSSIAQWFGILGAMLQLLIVATLVRKKLHARFPIFFSFLIYLVVGNFALTVLNIRISTAHYFALFWTLGALGMILGLGIIYEVFLNVLKSYPELLDFSKLLRHTLEELARFVQRQQRAHLLVEFGLDAGVIARVDQLHELVGHFCVTIRPLSPRSPGGQKHRRENREGRQKCAHGKDLQKTE